MMRRGSWLRWVGVLLVAITVLFTTGCGGEQLPPNMHVSSPVRALTIAVKEARRGERLGAYLALIDAMRAAGFSVAQDGGDTDLTATVTVETGTARVAGGFVTLHSPDAVRLTVTITSHGQPVEELRTDFVAGSGGVTAGDLDDLMQSLVNSPRLYAFGVATMNARAEEAQRLVLEREAQRREQEAEENRRHAEDAEAWVAASPGVCMEPKALDACDGVKAYLDRRPQGDYAATAQQLLRRAEVPLLWLRDDADWAAIDETVCAKPTSEQACDAISGYVTKYPNGRHVEHARELVEKAAPTIKKLRLVREAQEAREAAAEAARQQAAEASDDDGSYSGGTSGGGGGAVHVRGYYRNGHYVQPYTRGRPRRR